jgi:hypothetical protein
MAWRGRSRRSGCGAGRHGEAGRGEAVKVW